MTRKPHTITFEEIDGYEITAVIAGSSDGKRLSYVFNVNDHCGWYIVVVNDVEVFRCLADDGVHGAIKAYNNAEVYA
jgi:hypothetical protein